MSTMSAGTVNAIAMRISKRIKTGKSSDVRRALYGIVKPQPK